MRLFLFKIFFVFVVFSSSVNSYSQQLNQYFQNITNLVLSDSLVSCLKQVESLGIKTTPSTALSNASVWLYNKYLNMGYTNIKRDTFLFSNDTLVNIVVTKTGIIHPENILVICGHYDSKNGPGVNDNGSGVSIILEIARLMENIHKENTIRFINFTGEEEGLRGSEHYVDSIAVPQNQNIILVFNIDEVGGIAGMTNNIIMCEKDISYPSGNNLKSAEYTDTLVTLVHQYSSLQTEISNAWGSDYVPFQQAGFVITGLYEKNETTYAHTINDSLSKLDTNYVFEIAKASIGAALYFSKAIIPSSDIKLLKKNISPVSVFPNPFSDELFIDINDKSDYNFQLFDIFGKIIFTINANLIGRKNEVISSLKPDIYFYKLCNSKNEKLSVFGKICKMRQ